MFNHNINNYTSNIKTKEKSQIVNFIKMMNFELITKKSTCTED